MNKFQIFCFSATFTFSAMSFEYKEGLSPVKAVSFEYKQQQEKQIEHKMDYLEENSPYVSNFYYKERERQPSSPQAESFNYKELEEFSPDSAFNF